VKSIVMAAGALVAVLSAAKIVPIKNGFLIGGGIFAIGALLIPDTTQGG
jgi:hypothetical protein